MNQLDEREMHQHVMAAAWLNIVTDALWLLLGGCGFLVLVSIGLISADPTAMGVLGIIGTVALVFFGVLALPGILARSILTFILGMNAYATPVLLGGPKFKMMGPLVYGQFQLNNWPFGASAAFVLMTATLVLTATANLLVQRRLRR